MHRDECFQVASWSNMWSAKWIHGSAILSKVLGNSLKEFHEWLVWPITNWMGRIFLYLPEQCLWSVLFRKAGPNVYKHEQEDRRYRFDKYYIESRKRNKHLHYWSLKKYVCIPWMAQKITEHRTSTYCWLFFSPKNLKTNGTNAIEGTCASQAKTDKIKKTK